MINNTDVKISQLSKRWGRKRESEKNALKSDNSRSFLLTSLGYNVNQDCVCVQGMKSLPSQSVLERGVYTTAVLAVLFDLRFILDFAHLYFERYIILH